MSQQDMDIPTDIIPIDETPAIVESTNVNERAVETVLVEEDSSDSEEENGDVKIKVLLTRSKRNPKTNTKERGTRQSPTRDDEGECCPICFESWSNYGAHRLASLHCGHLFGRSCIEKWLRDKARNKCPQCNLPAKRKQIRNIYAKSVKTIDTSERDRALEELEKEKLARKNAEEAEAKALLQYRMARAECERMKSKLEKQQKFIGEQEQLAKQAQTSSLGGTSNNSWSNSQGQISNHKYAKKSSWQVSQSGARVMTYDEYSGALVVSKPSSNQLFSGYGVVKVSSLDNRHSEFVTIHEKAIRDAVFSNNNSSLLLTASMDKMLKITSIQSNNVVLSYSTPAAVWSCAWNTSDTNYIYAGLQNGECYVFDIRNTNGHLKVLEKNVSDSSPLVSLAFVPKASSSSFKLSGLFTCSLQGCCFWENIQDTEFLSHRWNLQEGSYTCLCFEPVTRHFLLSQRPSKNCSRSRHGIHQLQQQVQGTDENGTNTMLCSQVITQCNGGSSQKLLGRSTLFISPDDESKLLVAAGDESTKSTIVWDGSTGKEVQSLPSDAGETVIDVCSFRANNADFLATLTDAKLSFYKWH